MDKPAKPLERLSITISGLCLVVVKENRLATAADTVQVLIPDAPDHRPRLTFRRSNRTEQSDAPMERFFGPAGENLVSLPLYKTRARFDLKGNASPEFTMSWAPEKKIERPVPDDALDWLIDADDVELRPRNLCGVTCSILLPPGPDSCPEHDSGEADGGVEIPQERGEAAPRHGGRHRDRDAMREPDVFPLASSRRRNQVDRFRASSLRATRALYLE